MRHTLLLASVLALGAAPLAAQQPIPRVRVMPRFGPQFEPGFRFRGPEVRVRIPELRMRMNQFPALRMRLQNRMELQHRAMDRLRDRLEGARLRQPMLRQMLRRGRFRPI